jgi:hypothetical protein
MVIESAARLSQRLTDERSRRRSLLLRWHLRPSVPCAHAQDKFLFSSPCIRGIKRDCCIGWVGGEREVSRRLRQGLGLGLGMSPGLV